jgi:hypothetical protein
MALRDSDEVVCGNLTIPDVCGFAIMIALYAPPAAI